LPLSAALSLALLVLPGAVMPRRRVSCASRRVRDVLEVRHAPRPMTD
jgi:hypothetical protein